VTPHAKYTKWRLSYSTAHGQVVAGLYLTRISIVGALVGTTAVGVSNLTLGVQRDQTRLRMTGLVGLGAQALEGQPQLCVAGRSGPRDQRSVCEVPCSVLLSNAILVLARFLRFSPVPAAGRALPRDLPRGVGAGDHRHRAGLATGGAVNWRK
jgi:hypothetical protein